MTSLKSGIPSALLFALSLSGCARGPGHGEAAARVSVAERVVCGLAGAEAGRGYGYIVHASGEVARWRGRTSADGVVSAGVTPSALVAALWQAVQQDDFFRQDAQASAAPAAFVQVETAARAHRVSWGIGPGTSPPDSTLARLYRLCEETGAAAR